MHWILRDETTRVPFFSDVFRILKPGGSFVFEMGGAGNVPEVHAALFAVLSSSGISMEDIRKIDPWFFPSDVWMRQTLTNAGFDVQISELEYRPTRLNPDKNDGTGGLEGWIRLMAAIWLEALAEKQRDAAVRRLCDYLDPVVTRIEDGSKWLGYVRLRAVARKPY